MHASFLLGLLPVSSVAVVYYLYIHLKLFLFFVIIFFFCKPQILLTAHYYYLYSTQCCFVYIKVSTNINFLRDISLQGLIPLHQRDSIICFIYR